MTGERVSLQYRPVTGAPRRIVLIVPLAPQRSGNGLAMRAGATLEALAAAAPVDLVIVPVSGPSSDAAWARTQARSIVTVDLPSPDDAQAHVTALLADARLRHRLERTVPLPARAALAPPTLARSVADALPDEPTAAVVLMRTYLAPLGIELGRVLGTDRVVADADDDDEALLRSLGEDAEAEAFHRLAAAWLPDADEVWAAAPAEAGALRGRHSLTNVRTVPNTVRLPPPVAPAPEPKEKGGDRLLFVGNLTYAPNLDAARLLALDVLPLVRAKRPGATLDLVGAGSVDDLAAIEGVHVYGAVPDLASLYGRADVVVVPLRHGAGTRIKLLEAAAFHLPVVASPAALGGLELVPDHEVVVAEPNPEETAEAVVAVLADHGRATSIADAAHDAVARRYTRATVGPVIRRGALGELGPAATIPFRVLWHEVEVEAADEEVVVALEAMVPTSSHGFDATARAHYSVEGRRGAYRLIEDGDLVTTVATPEEARDEVHRRLHRRIFEQASRDGWIRLHGALVDFGSTRVLVTGPSGAGKSTLATRLLLDGHSVQGDESVMLRGRESVAVARPFHLKPGAEHLLPELRALELPTIDDVMILDPGRIDAVRVPWRLTVASLDHLVLLDPRDEGESAGEEVRIVAEPHTAMLPALVPQLFPVTETKSALLRALTGSLAGVQCHRLRVGDPDAMVHALVTDLG
jgi:glycosyltransferase involved in cell wall biosynthesis